MPASLMQNARESPSRIVSIDGHVPVEDMEQGLDWVRWVLQGVRQRGKGVIIPCQTTAAGVADQWRHFVDDLLSPALGPCMLAAVDAALHKDEAVLVTLDADWERELTAEQAERSLQAGALLLEKTAGARFQGVLGSVRHAVAEGHCAGHIGIVWPAVAALFQLTPVTALSEYVRLEWETCTRDLVAVPEPAGQAGFAQIVQRIIRLSMAPRDMQFQAAQNGLPLPMPPMHLH